MRKRFALKIRCDIATGRIVGGEDAEPHEFAYQVGVLRNRGNGFELECGGSVLNREWAVSASHCFYECPIEDTKKCNVEHCPYKPRREINNNLYLLRFGEFDLKDKDSE